MTFYLITTVLIVLANLFVASTVHAHVGLNSIHLLTGKTTPDPRILGDARIKLEISAVQKSGGEAVSFAQPTRTPRPTSTPPVIPPPASPTSMGLMILLAAVVMAVILGGIWINRRRVF